MPTDPTPRLTPSRRRPSRLAALLDTKLTPGVALLFFVALALMCAVAAGIGFVTQNLRHGAVHRS